MSITEIYNLESTIRTVEGLYHELMFLDGYARDPFEDNLISVTKGRIRKNIREILCDLLLLQKRFEV